MGLQKFQILYNNPHGVYYSGQQLIGNVHLAVNEPKKARAIILKIEGIANVRWEESRSESYTDSNGHSQTRTVTDVYSSQELYFQNTVQLFGGGESQVLAPGEYNFPFNCVLPYNIPSSFEGSHGHVRYSVRAIMDRPWCFNHEAKSVFTVLCPLDLNLQPALMEPIQTSAEKTFCCWCCASGPLSVILSLPVGGAVPGEIILPTVEVDNASRVNLENIKLYFIKITTYQAQGRTNSEEITISEIKLGCINAHQSNTWARKELSIPALPPSNLAHCNIIDVNYYVKVTCKPSGVHNNFSVTLPVTLGTVPFRNRFNNFSSDVTTQPLGWNLEPSAPPAPSAPMPDDNGPPQYSDLPPPSYQESMTGVWSVVEKDDSEYVIGDKTYAPKYPVYKRQ